MTFETMPCRLPKALRIGSLFVTLLAAACGGGSQKADSQKVNTGGAQSAVKSSQSTLKSQQPANPQSSMSLPKPAPAAKTAGSTTVAPPDPTSGGTASVNVWTFSAVDVDGNGPVNGTIAATPDGSTMLIWYSSSITASDGTPQGYDAAVWIDNAGAGFAFSFQDSSGLACGENATSSAGCVACDASGNCTVVGTGG